MGMSVDQPRQDGGVAQIDVRRKSAVRFDGGDLIADDGDDAALQRRGVHGEHPAGGQGP